jgi:putative membrane protein
VLRLLLRSVAINLAGVYIAAQILTGVITYVGGYKTLLMAAVVIAIVNLFVKPLINLLLLPIHLITVGLFRWIANLITLYLVTLVVPNLQIQPFIFQGVDLKYLLVPPIHFSAFGAFLVSTFVLTIIFHLLYWLLQD